MARARILVVEDEALIADDVRRTLTRLGYEVPITVASGAAALRATAEVVPDLVLMDIKLKGPMDGIETAERLREVAPVPVIYLTSHSDDATLDRAKRTRPYGYLLKPFDERDLRTAIEVALHKHTIDLHLDRRERWFSTTLASIGDAVIATDRERRITFMNAVAERITRWPADEARGRLLDDVYVLAGSSEAGPRPLGAGGAAARGASLRTRDGGALEIDVTAAPIVDARGEVLGSVLVFRDTTERRRMETRLARSERLAALGTLTAGLAHEINNPLAYVLASVDYGADLVRAVRPAMAADGVALAANELTRNLDDLERALGQARQGADRIRRLMQQLRRFGSDPPAERQAIDLPDVLDAAIELTAHALGAGARIVREYGTTPFVDADETRLTQVFVNLLVNAGHAIEESSAAAAEIRIRTGTDDEARAFVEVRDSGVGIPAEHLEAIFDPFFTTKTIGRGMGLGLAISHELVTSLGGSIAVESRVGHGTTVRVVLPPSTVRSPG